jgi:hypothetical protein
MSLDDIEKRLYKMKEGSPLEDEDEYLDYSSILPLENEEEKTENEKNKQEVPRYYSAKEETKKRPPIDFYEKKRKSNAWLYIVAGVLFVGLIVEGFFLAQKVSTQKTGINIDINSPNNILLGEPFTLEVSYKNNSDNLLQNAQLLLSFPENIKIIGNEETNSYLFKKDLGNLGTGSSNIEKFYLVAMGTPNRIEKIRATLQYNIVGFDGRFEKSKEQTITIGGPVIDYNVSVPENIISGEEFSFKVNFTNNSDKPLSDLKIQLFYPLGFSFSSADINPNDGNNVWIWKNLQPKERAEINISGMIIGEKNSFYEMGVSMNLMAENKTIELEKKVAMLKILETPLNLSISLNNTKNYIAKNNESLEYRIDYENNTSIALNDVIIKAELEGDMFNFSSVSTNGYFDSLKKQIIWNGGTNNELKMLNKGDKGFVIFKINTINDYPTRNFNDENQTLKVKVTIDSPSVPPNSSLKSTTAVAELITKMAGKIDFKNYALFRDAESGIVNKGSLPLRVGKTTNFTIHWKIINYNNDLENIIVKTSLPQGISWTGVYNGNYDDIEPQYNERTGEIIWNIKNIEAFSGILLPAKELIFQIAVTPSSNQIGTLINLTKEITLTAKDTFTNQEINLEFRPINSELSSDPTVGKNEGIVNP